MACLPSLTPEHRAAAWRAAEERVGNHGAGAAPTAAARGGPQAAAALFCPTGRYAAVVSVRLPHLQRFAC